MPDLHTRGHELEQAFKAMRKQRLPQAPHVSQHRDRYLKPAATEDWKRLTTSAVKQRETASTGLKRLASLQAGLQRLHERAMAYVAEAEQDWEPLRTRPDWPEIRERILAKLPEGTPSHVAEELVRRVGKLRRADLSAHVLEPLRSRADRLDGASISWQTALIGAELAETVATFNELKRPSLEAATAIDKWLRDATSMLESKERAIWRSLRRGKLDNVEAASKELLQWACGELLEKATRTASALSVARRDPRNRWSLGRQAMATADLIRSLLAAQVLSYRTAWLSRLGFGPVKDWCEAAARLPFPTRWQPPSVTPADTLWAQSGRYNGKVVTIQGVVGPVSNTHLRRKVYSSVWLSEPQGTSMRVGITHIKLDSGGLVEGAYARVTGKFVAKDKDFGTPLVRVSRRTLVKDSEQSWKDWSVLRTQRLFAPVPHALTLSFSWEKGLDGPGNQLRYGTWLANAKGD